ncbi:hypothetical protein F5Y16DRAFT_401327 [Xylariaceae sp. FL0255]|nr:hypothetical protein F5Y16DRAFT_401327 [Xylariaceae sp. FL0255]
MSGTSEIHEEQSTKLVRLDDYASPRIRSTQTAKDLYDAGAKLWTKESLRDIEMQVLQAYKHEYFKLPCLDGSTVEVKNPYYQDARRDTVWLPYIEFRDYWDLIKEESTDPEALWQCLYLIKWEYSYEDTFYTHNDNISKADGELSKTYSEMSKLWRQSRPFQYFAQKFRSLLYGKNITKITCFALGDFTRWAANMERLDEISEEVEHLKRCMRLHIFASSMADIDPSYHYRFRDILEENGFKVVGPHGTEGFAEIDDETLVFSAGMNYPVKQIIAEIARPAIIITPAGLCNNPDLSMDPHSPRTDKLWRQYTRYEVTPNNALFEMKGRYARKMLNSQRDLCPWILPIYVREDMEEVDKGQSSSDDSSGDESNKLGLLLKLRI